MSSLLESSILPTNSSEISQSYNLSQLKNINQSQRSIKNIEVENSSRTKTLTSSQLQELNLKPGRNELVYSVTTSLQGTRTLTAYIYLWKQSDRIIVSDIDGTITKSDFRGQIYSIFGLDWYHEGVASLFNAVERNNYKFIYLTARSIIQADLTRNMIRSISQNECQMPDGPLLLYPKNLIDAIQLEVISRTSQEFKMDILSQIKSLFIGDALKYSNPFYAGFGNRQSDLSTYKNVGIAEETIFIVNPLGQISYDQNGKVNISYSKLIEFIDCFFPAF